MIVGFPQSEIMEILDVESALAWQLLQCLWLLLCEFVPEFLFQICTEFRQRNTRLEGPQLLLADIMVLDKGNKFLQSIVIVLVLWVIGFHF